MAKKRKKGKRDDIPKRKKRRSRKERLEAKAAAEQRKEERELPPPGYTYKLHKDDRDTVVEINGAIYKLVATGQSLKDIMGERDFKKVPHVRYLNPIREVPKSVQVVRNKEAEEIHDLAVSAKANNKSGKVTSLKKAAAMGANVPEEIDRLMKEKEKARKAGDETRCRAIRRQLRKLDYKRYKDG